MHSMKYAVPRVEELAHAAAAAGQPAIALVDRDNISGAVQFVRACEAVGIAPILGVDLAVRSASSVLRRPAPVKGGRSVVESAARVAVLAYGESGWSALCRLVSRAHARVSPDSPVGTEQCAVTVDDIVECSPGLVVMLGPQSEIAVHVARRRPDLARHALKPWLALPAGDVLIEVVSHRTAPVGQSSHRQPDYSTAAARRLLAFAHAVQIPVVMSNAVRYIEPRDEAVADVLDAVRTLTTIEQAPRTGHGAHFLDSQQMRLRAHEICAESGIDASQLLRTTARTAYRCRLSSKHLGLGTPRVPEVFGIRAQATLEQRCWQGMADYERTIASVRVGHGIEKPSLEMARHRLVDELAIIRSCGFAGYFLTVADIVDLIKRSGIRVSARGSGAGSLVNHILGVSAVNPLQHGLVMERFLSALRTGLPDIDIDVESARRLEVYDLIFTRFGTERTACVSMTDTYRVRHAIRDVGRALGLASGEVAALATSFPHIRARDIRAAVRDLPELRDSSFIHLLRSPQWQMLVECVERLDGLPRHRAMHPCGIILSDTSLLERTAVEPSRQGYPMSQFDKDDVEQMGFLKLDVLGVRMQSALAHAVAEVDRVSGVQIDLERIPHDDKETFDLIASTRTLGCFQIESPGQRELVGKFSPETFDDLIIDISLFRPGPVKSDMVTPFLNARHGYQMPDYIHESLRPILAQTYGVVAFHEQVIRIIDVMTGCGLAHADEVRRALGSVQGQDSLRQWFYRCAQKRAYGLVVIERVWDVLRAFASFGFCKAHAAAFAVPTYQSAWLKRHHPAAFFAGVLTYDPGMYPKRLILDDARHFGVAILPVDINESDAVYRVDVGPRGNAAIRLPLSEVAGISEAEVQAAIAQRPYHSVLDVVYRSGLSRPVVESLIEVGACDVMHGITQTGLQARETVVSRRDLLIEVARHRRGRRHQHVHADTLFSAATTDMTSAPRSYGLPEMGVQERVARELAILSMDVSEHALSAHIPFLRELKATRSSHLLRCRSQQEVVVAGIKVAIQTPPVRSGRRVVFVTLDDGAGPVDITFFEDVQEEFASTLFTSWLLLVRGHVRRTGARGLSVRATGCWDLVAVESVWRSSGVDAARCLMDGTFGARRDAEAVADASTDMSTPTTSISASTAVSTVTQGRAASRSVRPVLVHPSGFRQSPYADIRPAGMNPARQHIIGQTGRDG